ncbi:hypothetical protein AOQ84DRAFT_440038 [Glonium stellatum]|uniref:Mid2 domain-containing protein n=1 Tax=Glonium stellatum TaxID=574774 RepID=A0A8E2JS81_9PEZI|nr:hypothetical protein AOQ84DRAFT_440038 [Glonium stellatum]
MLRSKDLFALVVPLLYPLSAIASQTCYWPNGAVAQGYIPCNPNQPNSMCCADQGQAACLSNGLCLWLADFSIDRGGCTDSSWASSACVQTCRSDPNDGHADVTQCVNAPSGLEWCCGFNNDCCNGTGGVTAVGVAASTGGSFYAISMPGSSATSATLSTSSVTVSTTSNSISTASSSSTLSSQVAASATTCSNSDTGSPCHEVAIGAGVGVPLGLAFIFALSLFLLERWKRKRDNAAAYSSNVTGGQQTSYKYDHAQAPQQMPASEISMMGNTPTSLQGTHPPVELKA